VEGYYNIKHKIIKILTIYKNKLSQLHKFKILFLVKNFQYVIDWFSFDVLSPDKLRQIGLQMMASSFLMLFISPFIGASNTLNMLSMDPSNWVNKVMSMIDCTMALVSLCV